MVDRIFLNYRRDDSIATARTVHELLAKHFGKDKVFQDIPNIPVGVDYKAYVDKLLGETDVFVALIGKAWLNVRDEKTGMVRIEDPKDLVRAEIKEARVRNISIIPVLVDGAKMPDANDIPEDFQFLPNLNALKFNNDEDFQDHCKRLIDRVIEVSTPAVEPPILPTNPPDIPRPGKKKPEGK